MTKTNTDPNTKMHKTTSEPGAATATAPAKTLAKAEVAATKVVEQIHEAVQEIEASTSTDYQQEPRQFQRRDDKVVRLWLDGPTDEPWLFRLDDDGSLVIESKWFDTPLELASKAEVNALADVLIDMADLMEG